MKYRPMTAADLDRAVNDRFHAHFYGRLGYRPATNLVLMSKMLTDG